MWWNMYSQGFYYIVVLDYFFKKMGIIKIQGKEGIIILGGGGWACIIGIGVGIVVVNERIAFNNNQLPLFSYR